MKKAGVSLIGGLAVAVAALAAAAPAQAARHSKHVAATAPKDAVPAARALGTFDAWTAYASEDKTGRVCYLAGAPKKSEPADVARNPPMAMVTHRPTEHIANVVSFVAGYPLKDGSDAILEIGHRKFELFTNADSAWARTSELDRTIVSALAGAEQAVVTGVPQKGPKTRDVYSLAGFPKALAAIDKACGVKREEAAPRPAHPAHHPATHKRPKKPAEPH